MKRTAFEYILIIFFALVIGQVAVEFFTWFFDKPLRMSHHKAEDIAEVLRGIFMVVFTVWYVDNHHG